MKRTASKPLLRVDLASEPGAALPFRLAAFVAPGESIRLLGRASDPKCPAGWTVLPSCWVADRESVAGWLGTLTRPQGDELGDLVTAARSGAATPGHVWDWCEDNGAPPDAPLAPSRWSPADVSWRLAGLEAMPRFGTRVVTVDRTWRIGSLAEGRIFPDGRQRNFGPVLSVGPRSVTIGPDPGLHPSFRPAGRQRFTLHEFALFSATWDEAAAVAERDAGGWGVVSRRGAGGYEPDGRDWAVPDDFDPDPDSVQSVHCVQGSGR